MNRFHEYYVDMLPSSTGYGSLNNPWYAYDDDGNLSSQPWYYSPVWVKIRTAYFLEINHDTYEKYPNYLVLKC